MASGPQRLIIGTRGSKLALAQTGWVADRLREVHEGLQIDQRIMKTKGDQQPDRPLGQIGGKGIFTKELEDGLLSGEIDVAVHSAKDLPTETPEGLVLAATPMREDPRDALIAEGASSVQDLSQGALVGTGSLRRQAQLLAMRADLRFTVLRGNVDTRIEKVLRRGECEATLLAVAGLRRVGLEGHIRCILSLDQMVPACGQGVLALQARSDDTRVSVLVAAIHNEQAAEELRCERCVVRQLDAGCRAPVGVNARIEGDSLSVRAVVALPDGTEKITTELHSGVGGWQSLADRVVKHLLADRADEILRRCRDEQS